MKENSYFVDTNIFLRPIVKDSQKAAQECKELFQKIRASEINAFTSNLVLVEIHWVLKRFYQLKKGDLLKILKGIYKFKHLRIENKQNMGKALELYEKHSVKLVDAIIASHSRVLSKEVVIISYDKDFDKLGVLRKEPKDLL